MDPQVSTSFIPKKTLETGGSRPVGRGTGLLLLLAILVFVASLVSAGGVFAYKEFLKQSIASKGESLKLNEKAYNPGVIQELVRIDTRINEAQKLLGKHVAPSAIFTFLSQQTLAKVQFKSFDYVANPDGSSKITLAGLSDSFSTLALQSDQLGASKVLKDVIFSGVTVDSETGKVAFTVTATVAASLTQYSAALTSGGAASGSVSSEQPASSTSQ